MNYKFPIIEDIQQVREAIQGRPEFVESDKGEYIVFNYHVSMPDSFPPVKTAGGSASMREKATLQKSLLRECRGLIFNKQGKVISRRFHKFFNLNEREETLESKIDFSRPYIKLSKLDGSMMTPLLLSDGLHWATKMGVTDIGNMCKEFVDSVDIPYKKYVESCEDEYTPIFEFMSPQTRIVIDHKQPSLTLLALRHNITGEYVPYDELSYSAKVCQIPVVPQLEIDHNKVKDLEGEEGIVIRFDDGHMVKVKSEWYCRIHKAKDNILFEKNVIQMILAEKLDDIIPHLPEEDRVKLYEYQKDLLQCIDLSRFMIEAKRNYYEKTLTKKDFALQYANNCDDLERQAIFATWDNNKDVREYVINYIIKHTRTQTEVEKIRYLLPPPWRKVKYE